MKHLWFITNPSSGSADAKKCEALEAVFDERGLTLAGRTRFPEEGLPTPASLDEAGVDTAVLFAGDGTINAATTALAEWGGAILILPGGTMNMLAKILHGPADPTAIIHAAHERAEKVSLPFAQSAESRALVGLIIGPVAAWVRPRELARKGRLKRVVPAIRAAWRRTFGRGVRITGAPGLPHRVQAVFVTPEPGRLDVATVDARDWSAIAELGWSYLTGDWVAARAVTEVRADSLTVAERRPVQALFDGEPVTLPPGARIVTGVTRPQFLSTVSK